MGSSPVPLGIKLMTQDCECQQVLTTPGASVDASCGSEPIPLTHPSCFAQALLPPLQTPDVLGSVLTRGFRERG